MFQFHTPGSKALPFTFLDYGSCTLKKKKKIKNSLLVCYCIQNQTKHGEMSLNILKSLSEKVLFGFCFQAELQTRQRICVFWGTHSKEWRDTDDLLSSVHCLGLSSFWSFSFLWGLVLFPFLVVLAGFCLLPFQGLCIWGWNVVMPNKLSNLRALMALLCSVMPGRRISAPLPSCYM